jgi:heat shock protein HtpX
LTLSLLRQPFVWYGRAFLRMTNAISRRQEFAADACAVARVVHDSHVEPLRRVHAYAPLFDAYWQQDVVPALSNGLRPPLSAGFSCFAAAEGPGAAAQDLLDQELGEARTGPYDSHPALAEQIAAVEHLPAGEPDESGPAIALVDDPEVLETRIVEFLFGPEAHTALEVAGWEAVADRVYVPAYEALVTRHASTLEGITFATLPQAVDRLADMGVEMRRVDADVPTGLHETADAAAALLAAGGVLALRVRGWTVDALPGQPVLCRRDDVGVSPHQIVAMLRSPETERANVEAELRELGIADVALAEGASAANANGAGAQAVGSAADAHGAGAKPVGSAASTETAASAAAAD